MCAPNATVLLLVLVLFLIYIDEFKILVFRLLWHFDLPLELKFITMIASKAVRG